VAGLTGWAVHGLLDFDLYVPGVAWPAFILLGVVQGLKEGETVAPRRLPALLGGLTAVTVAGAVWLTGRSLWAAHEYGVQQRLEQTHPVGALAVAQQVIQRAPHNGRYLAQAGELAARLGRWDEAADFYRRAIAADPYRASYHWGLARVLAAEGRDEAGALAALRRAVALNPTKKIYVDSLAAAEESVRQGGGRLLESAPDR
jgi:tetratricopeptide (TPR) repeat protein